MGLLGKIFKKKVGGTFVGNLIRGVAKQYTGGILGSGSAMKQAPDPVPQAGEAPPQLNQLPPVSDGASPLTTALNSFLKKSTEGVGVEAGMDKKTMWYVGGVVGAILLVILVTRKK